MTACGGLDVAPHEEIKKLAVFPQLREVQIKPPSRRLDTHNRDGARGSTERVAILFGDRREPPGGGAVTDAIRFAALNAANRRAGESARPQYQR